MRDALRFVAGEYIWLCVKSKENHLKLWNRFVFRLLKWIDTTIQSWDDPFQIIWEAAHMNGGFVCLLMFTTYCTIFIHTYTVSLIIVHSIRQSSIESRLRSRGLELPENPLQHPNSSQLLPCPLHAGRIKPFCHCDCHWVNPLYLPLLGVGLVTGLYVLLTMYQERWLSLKLEFQIEILEGACVLFACLQYLWRHYRFIGNSTSLNDIKIIDKVLHTSCFIPQIILAITSHNFELTFMKFISVHCARVLSQERRFLSPPLVPTLAITKVWQSPGWYLGHDIDWGYWWDFAGKNRLPLEGHEPNVLF